MQPVEGETCGHQYCSWRTYTVDGGKLVPVSGSYAETKAMLISGLDLSSKTILEIGCDAGQLLQQIPNGYKSYTGIDVSDVKRLPVDSDSVKFIVGDAFGDEVELGKYDVVFALSLAHYLVPRLRDYLRLIDYPAKVKAFTMDGYFAALKRFVSIGGILVWDVIGYGDLPLDDMIAAAKRSFEMTDLHILRSNPDTFQAMIQVAR